MTVGLATGGANGDCLGVRQISSPVFTAAGKEEGASPEGLPGGRFWVLQELDDEEDGQAEVTPVRDWASMRYGCHTPSSASGRDLDESSTALARRALKRVHRQQAQRLAATAVIELDEGMVSPSSRPLGKSTSKIKVLPVLEPTVFRDESSHGWSVVHRRRWLPAIGKKRHDPLNSLNSNLDCSGQQKPWADDRVQGARRGPLPIVHRALQAARRHTRSESRYQRVEVGGVVAGRSFHKFLGFTWKRLETGAPAALRRSQPSKMSGDGGQNFNPGRGSFNHGRGGFQPQGGFGGAGRGAFAARGRQGLRGQGGYGAGPGYGFGGGRAGQAASMNSHGRNYGRGDAGGAAGRTGGHGVQEENWDDGPSNYQRGPRFGFGANQRWNNNNNAGRGGYQNRATSHGGVARGGFDADLLQQTVQAVVAAVTAAQKVPEAAGMAQVQATPPLETVAVNREEVVPVAAPTVGQQQRVVAQQVGIDPQIVAAKGKEVEGPGPSKKKKEEKSGCFRCKQPGH
ncbi:hypothetical protein QYE76_014436 [Lolium multiflorum]|uniref:Uncharacterized protein n=1 Tax=Lolium multiflorum TaxID=4521 RepID=A0AAD8U644_LOLMU|nr:hypothetical protein QYE76_014436 [Lolium multiflorum]